MTLLALCLGGCGTGSGSSVSIDNLGGGTLNGTAPDQVAPGAAKILYQFNKLGARVGNSRIDLPAGTQTVRLSVLDAQGNTLPLNEKGPPDPEGNSVTVSAAASAELLVPDAVVPRVAATLIIAQSGAGDLSQGTLQAYVKELTLSSGQSVTVDSATPTSFQLTKTELLPLDESQANFVNANGQLNLNNGQSTVLGVTGTFVLTGSNVSFTSLFDSSEVTYTSSNSSLVKVDSDGLVTMSGTAQINQHATITATVRNGSSTVKSTLLVNATGVGGGITLSLSQSSFTAGQTGTYSVIDGTGANVTASATITVANTSVATASGGVISAIAAGTTGINASVNGGTSQTLTISVTGGNPSPTPAPSATASPGPSPSPGSSPSPIAGVQLVIQSLNLAPNGITNYQVFNNGADVTSTATLQISNPGAVKMSAVGQLQGVATGSSTVTAVVNGVSSTAITVTVSVPGASPTPGGSPSPATSPSPLASPSPRVSP